MEKVAIGKIVKAIGLNGEVKVISLTDFPLKRFKSGKEIELLIELDNDLVKTTIEKVRLHRHLYILKFKGLDTIESVLPFLNYLIVSKKDRTIEKTGSFYC